ncbi:MAG: TetR/AcrR family transcriptional regulator [Bacteroidales bacterium]|nr:TetR/AcrR family transcriptional regulator [Bacteroidales bacterium]
MIDKEKIRRKIIIDAGDIFSRFGFRKTTMSDIARKTGMGKSSLYYYFNSKEEVFEQVVIYEADILIEELTKALERSNGAKEKLKSYISVRMQVLHKLSNYYNAVFSDDLSHFDFIERVRERYNKQEIQTIQRILKRGIEQGQFEIDNTELAAIAIFTAMKGLEIPLFWHKVSDNPEIRFENMLNILFYGIVKKS